MIPAPLTKAAGLLVLLLLWCLSTLSAVAAADLANNNGPVQFRSKVIPNQYIVEYHPGTPAAVREQHEAEVHAGASVVPFASSSASGGSVRNYRGVVRSFAIGDGSKFAAYHGELDAASVERLRGHELIKAVHPDYAIQMIANNATDSDFDSDSDFDWDPLGFPAPQASNSSSDNCPSSSRADCPDPASDPDSNIFVAPSHNWGQARISHRENAQKTSKSSSSSNSNSNSGENDDDDEKYVYESTVSTVYVIDSGIQLGHWEFTSPSSDSSARDLNKRDEGGDGHAGEKSRAKLGKNFVNGNDTDELGHGTHVAGIVAGRTVGVAPLAEVIALKVMNGTGFAQWSLVIDALEWACADALSRHQTHRSVINISIGSPTYYVLDNAIRAAVQETNITIVAAAGNSDWPVSGISPAGSPDVLAIGSVSASDTRSSFSNYGPGISVFAPGEAILSSCIGESNNQTCEMSGTSMSSPFVAGLAAYFMHVYGPHTNLQMRERIEGWVTKGKIQNGTGEGLKGSPNRIAFNGNWAEF